VIRILTTTQKNNETIKEFQAMRDMAELKALSKISLERPLTQTEYEKMMMFKNKFFPVSDNEFKKMLK